MEDSENLDAWVYSALCAAHESDLSNLDRAAQAVDSYLDRAADIDAKADIYLVGQSKARNTLGRTIVRAVEGHREAAQKAYFAYSSTSPAKARELRDAELQRGLSYAEYALRHPPDDPTISGPIAVVTLLNLKDFQKHNAGHQLASKAEKVLERIQQMNPKLHETLSSRLSKRAANDDSQGCLSALVVVFTFLTGAMAVLALLSVTAWLAITAS